MPAKFWIGFTIFALGFYFIGFIGWRVQNDAMKRGFGRTSATFWGVGTIFLPFIFFPLYILFRSRATGYVVEEIKPEDLTLCPHCGEKNPKVNELCDSCGKRMQITLPEFGEKGCPNCGHMNPVTAEYCTNCDERISFKS